ncbi:MAG: aminotransferase class V-fold PLP-dependent enzyme [Fimbriimonadaceae bacterium]
MGRENGDRSLTLPAGPLSESALREHVWPLFSASLARPGIYLANHSLGRPLDRMAVDVAEFCSLWYEDMDQAWDAWQSEQLRFTTLVERLIGAAPGTVTQRASAGQGLRAVLNSFHAGRSVQVVTTAGEFDSIDFILRAYVQAGRASVKWVDLAADGVVGRVDPKAILAAVSAETDLVVVSHVLFGTGHIFPNLRDFIAACRGRGAAVLVDLYHSAGVLPIDVSHLGAAFAVGGSYKYLRGGPGAAWLYIAPEVLDSGCSTVDTGWFAKAETFDYRRGDAIRRRPGIGGWAESTPPVIATYQARSGVTFTLEVGVERVRAYSLERQGLLRSILKEAGLPVFEPDPPEAFGAFSLLRSDDAKQVCEKAAAKGVTVDCRGQMIRVCPDILNHAEEFENAAQIVGECMR